MKILKWIEHQEEMEIDLSVSDLSFIFREGSEENERIAIMNLNDVISFLIALPNEIIEKLRKDVRETVSRHLLEQAERYKDI